MLQTEPFLSPAKGSITVAAQTALFIRCRQQINWFTNPYSATKIIKTATRMMVTLSSSVSIPRDS